MVEGERDRSEMGTEAFLEALGDELQDKPDVDKELAGILSAHILQCKPTQDGVARARAAIVELAAGRARRAEAGTIDG